MALTPKLALGNKPDELKKRVDRYEKQLDIKLAAEYNGRSSVTLSMPYSEDEWVVEQLKSRFKAAGWAVEVKKYAGSACEIRFAAMAEHVKFRFERAGWEMIDADSSAGSGSEAPTGAKSVRVYRSVADAVEKRTVLEESIEVLVKSDVTPSEGAAAEGGMTEHREKV